VFALVGILGAGLAHAQSTTNVTEKTSTCDKENDYQQLAVGIKDLGLLV
jgi:hypothetical protein